MKAIKVYQRPYSYTYEGGYTGDVTMTGHSADTIVEILNIKRVFENDEYMHKAREWVNQTFAAEEHNEIKNQIQIAEKQIELLEEEIRIAKSKLLNFLVDVDMLK